MLTAFRYAVSKSRGAILGWGLGLFAFGLIIIPIYDAMAAQLDGFIQLVDSYPPQLSAFFGDLTKMATPAGFLGVEYFSYMHIILGMYALGAGSAMLATDEESGRLDLLLAHPVSRTSFFFGRLRAEGP